MIVHPWDISSDLKEFRLIALAQFIAAVRNEVIDLFDEELGDTRLSLGMRAYECCRTRIKEVAGSQDFPYLSILTPDGRFTFAVGETPVRYTRNDPECLPDRKIVVSQAAMQQMQMFSDVNPYANVRWFFVFDTDFKSAADAVYFVGYSELGEIVCQWQIPMEDSVAQVSDTTENLSSPVKQDKPVVKIKKIVTDKDKEDDGK
jgi:hypothetical protein